jgi:predicted DNA binding CopG/RHH family protein
MKGGLMARDRANKLSIVKTLRLSEALLHRIKAECTARNLRFSDFMRRAALAAVNPEIP